MEIRPIERSDRVAWRGLWDAYLEFYETTLSGEHSDSLWERILDPTDPIECLVAEIDDGVVGMVQYLHHANTWTGTPVCYLQDLFVSPAVRGLGIGAGLIEAVKEVADNRGWAGVYWHTADDNRVARGLYDKLTGGPAGFIVYELTDDGPM